MPSAPVMVEKRMVRGHAHECLRASTHALHKILDSRFDLSRLSSRPGYSEFLLANWPVASIEPALECAGVHRLLPDWSSRRRRDALASDLNELGRSLPHIQELVIESDEGTLLGWTYVLEGSRLGARMIEWAINGRKRGQIAGATALLRHGVSEHLWDSYKAALARIDRDPAAISNACAGAEAAFECFLDAP